jgi:hypothetical protein
MKKTHSSTNNRKLHSRRYSRPCQGTPASYLMKYQIHRCRTNICGGPGVNGKCSKGFNPCDVSDTTHHEPGKSRYTYARGLRGENDVWVSPYNP